MSSHDIALSVRGLSKSYTIAHNASKHTTAAEALVSRLRHPLQKSESETFWALKDVEFDIKKGDVVGIIGRNGAGKSTLLKILSRITEPTTGRIELYGRVGSLLEVGTGFHPELTGRENIFLNGAILGMSKHEIARQFDAIVDFSGTEQFLDTPVKRYSSGMYVRLAFAVAAHLNPEILIVDEVLAVGDAEFQNKCMGKMQDVARNGRTVLFVSHNIAAVKSLCSHAMLLSKGNVVAQGRTQSVLDNYLTANATQNGYWRRPSPLPKFNGIFIEELSVTNSSGVVTGNVACNEPFTLSLMIAVSEDIAGTQIAVRVTNQEGVAVFTTANSDSEARYQYLNAGRHNYKVQIPQDLLSPGTYSIIAATMIPSQQLFDIVENEISFVVEDLGSRAIVLRDNRLGIITPILEWKEPTCDGIHTAK